MTILDEFNLYGMTGERLVEHLGARGEALALAEARRLLAQVISHGRADWSDMTRPVSRSRITAVEAHTRRDRPEIVNRVDDLEDGSVRYLFRAADGALFEAVRIPLHQPGRFTVCLSSQVGCAMGCVFCATGRLGLSRNLETWEMVASFCAVRDEAPGRVSGAVFMGQGEPLHNYDRVIAAARVLSDPCGGRIRAEAITISTVGLPGPIRRYAEEGHPYRLIVSYSSAVPARRQALLPVAGRAARGELVLALRALHQATGERVTLAWVLMAGVNTGEDELAGLAELSSQVPIRLNLIDVNDARGDGYAVASDAERGRFHDGLRALGIPVIRRFSVGRGQSSACGMLAALAQESLSLAEGPDHAAPQPTGDLPPA